METKPTSNGPSLRAGLTYEPHMVKFGTSGRRGEIIHLTQLEVYINALAEVEYLQARAPAEGGIRKGDPFYYAYDLRPSSSHFVAGQQRRGEIVQAIERAIRDAGMQPMNLGAIPTPALAAYALARGNGCMMITGSHIPFDRNGFKTYSARGELLKSDEAPINARVVQVRARFYEQPYAESLFDSQGMFKCGHQELSPGSNAGRETYARRYTDFFAADSLHGLRLLVYQHSAVGRDLLVDILKALGATVITAGRSDTFVPIDTENIDDERLAVIQALAAQAGELDAVVSTDGDSDRPLILAAEHGRVKFFGGDLVGMVVAEFLGADAVVVPVNCNDALDRGPLKDVLEPKTRIGSPYVIAGMELARKKGRKAICGWEANGGFFLGSDINVAGRVLKALPTRDAVLPILGVLCSMRQKQLSMIGLFDQLPRRYSRSALLRNISNAKGNQIVRRFTPASAAIRQIVFGGQQPVFLDAERRELPAAAAQVHEAEKIRSSLVEFFSPALGFGDIARLDYTDGVRIYFGNDVVTHIRPSGNADELRIYALADTQTRANEIAALGIAEPNGLLRRLERAT